MFYIGKLVDYLLLPPGIFILLLLLGAIYAWRFRAILLLGAVSLYLLSIKPVSNALLEPLEKFNINETNSPKAVVFLGGGTNSNGVFKAYPDAFKREMYALIISKEKRLPLLFTGGGINAKEAIDTKKDIEYISKSFNFSPEVYYENKSLNTWENAKYSAEFLTKRDGVKI